MRYAVMVAQHENFRHAAEHLYVSQSALSQQITKLEDELGEPLFERHSGGVSLTEPGERFIQKAQGVLDLAQEAKNSVNSSQQTMAGDLAIGWLPTVHSGLINTLLEELSNNPDVSLRIQEGQPEHLINQLTLGNLDHLIVSGQIEDANLTTHELGNESFKLVLPASWDLSDRGGLTLNQLSDRHFLAVEEGHSYRKELLSLYDTNQTRPDFIYRGNSLHKLTEWVGNGAGYTILPELFADNVSSNDVIIRNFADRSPNRKLLYAHRQSGHQDLLHEWFQTEAEQWFTDKLSEG